MFYSSRYSTDAARRPPNRLRFIARGVWRNGRVPRIVSAEIRSGLTLSTGKALFGAFRTPYSRGLFVHATPHPDRFSCLRCGILSFEFARARCDTCCYPASPSRSTAAGSVIRTTVDAWHRPPHTSSITSSHPSEAKAIWRAFAEVFVPTWGYDGASVCVPRTSSSKGFFTPPTTAYTPFAIT